ncbi:MAG: recombinase [Armatimonadetes bacterium]|nr:recombinase [Armatimonadota bacterium]PIU89728.1 MAG: recombinase [Armatimonadetes bacterium CG06_land_8_20_14_3_00_66_21]PIX37544.1 MAG: recombinase [Armatimonadetes bacterium CG_4_8_14_3_um_filter_66_20]PJB68788.1 MAG: recombinase [Armatimonadetes bacterium CG_4_9_14_3_um_filter_66_14]NCO95495.1 recombinase [Armatimonadota bacterium]
MANDYAEYERECERIRQVNAALLGEFSDWLAAKRLSEATVRRHCENMEFYLNDFLLYEDAERAEDGVHRVGMFLGYWFTRKALWASEAFIKSNAASLKKFYTFMHENGKVNQEDLDDLKMQIKEQMPEWLATLARFDDPDIDDPADVWGL